MVFSSVVLALLLMGPHGVAVSAITAVFGADIGSPATGINRQKLGEQVFTDTDKKQVLEAIIHPLVRQQKTASYNRPAGNEISCVS